MSAYDFEKDGICYNILSEEDATVEMTYRCRVVNYNWDDDGMRYTGEISLPPKVVYNGKEYTVVAIGKNAVEYGVNIKRFDLPETLVEIKDSALYHCRLGQYKLPQSLRKIGESAFVNSMIYETGLPDSLEEIGYGAFYACAMMDTLVIPNSVKKLGDYAFASNEMKKVILPKNLERIGSGSFNNCEWLEEVVMPQNVTEIGDRAFLDCGWLSRLELPETVKRVGEYAFSDCGWDLKFTKLPDSLEYVGLGAFPIFDSLTIPANLDTIEGGALSVRNSFKVHPANKSYRAIDDCLYTVNMDSIIRVPTGKTEVSVPYGVRRIGAYAFRSSKIKDIVLPNSLRVIGKAAFEGCQLASISLPDSIEIIMEDAFEDCHFEDVKLPANLRLIKCFAFFGSLGDYPRQGNPYPKLILPEKLDSIGQRVFDQCYIDTVVSLNPIPPKNEWRGFGDFLGYFSDSPYYDMTLIVPVGSRQLYAEAPEWKYFKTIEEADLSSVDAVVSDNTRIEIRDGMISIFGKHDETLIEVYNFSGRLIHSGKSPEIHGLPTGMYILKIGTLAKKIVV